MAADRAWKRAWQRLCGSADGLPSDAIAIHWEIQEADDPTGVPALVAYLEIGGQVFDPHDHGPVDLVAYAASLASPGTHLVFGGESAEAGCASHRKGVAVEHRGDRIVWNGREARALSFVFERTAYRRALRDALIEGRRLVAQSPGSLEPKPASLVALLRSATPDDD